MHLWVISWEEGHNPGAWRVVTCCGHRKERPCLSVWPGTRPQISWPPAQHTFLYFLFIEWISAPRTTLPTPFPNHLQRKVTKGFQEEGEVGGRGDLRGLPSGGGKCSSFPLTHQTFGHLGSHWSKCLSITRSHPWPQIPSKWILTSFHWFPDQIRCIQGGQLVALLSPQNCWGARKGGQEYREKGGRGEACKREEEENWKQKETKTCHLAWKGTFPDPDGGCEWLGNIGMI